MNQAAVLVRANVCLIPEVPLVALLGIRITLLVAILRGRRRGNQALFLKQPDNLSKQFSCNPLRTRRLRNRPRVSRSVPDCWISRHKTPKRLGFRLLWSLRPKVIEILQQVQPQHPFQTVGLIPVLSFVIARPDDGFPFSPRNGALYLFQKFFLFGSNLS